MSPRNGTFSYSGTAMKESFMTLFSDKQRETLCEYLLLGNENIFYNLPVKTLRLVLSQGPLNETIGTANQIIASLQREHVVRDHYTKLLSTYEGCDTFSQFYNSKI